MLLFINKRKERQLVIIREHLCNSIVGRIYAKLRCHMTQLSMDYISYSGDLNQLNLILI